MLTVLLALVELAYPLVTGCFGAFEVFVVVLPLPPQAATASELNTASKPNVALKDLMRDICRSCH
jgi:hypothetical protein